MHLLIVVLECHTVQIGFSASVSADSYCCHFFKNCLEDFIEYVTIEELHKWIYESENIIIVELFVPHCAGSDGYPSNITATFNLYCFFR